MARRGFTIVRTPFPVYVRTPNEAFEWVHRFYETGQDVGFDTETTGLHVIKDRIRFFSFAQEDSRICAPVRLLHCFADLLEDEDLPKRMSNAKYDMHMATNHGIVVRGHVQDTIDQDFLYDENRQGRHGLKQTALDHLGLRMTPFKKVFGDVGKVENEVRTLCEVHDILEMHDHEGRVAAARAAAMRLLVRLAQVSGDEDVLRALKKLDLSMRAGNKMSARQVLKIARDQGYAYKTAGKGGYISDFVRLLGGPELATQDERNAWASVLEREGTVAEAHNHVWSMLLEELEVTGDPVEKLRTLIMDYASLDAWASYSLVDELRELLELEDMVTEAVDAGDEDPITLLEHSEEDRVPFIRTLWNMERRGFVIDVDQCHSYAKDMQKELDKIEKEIVQETRDINFNPNSPVQLRAALFDKTLKGWEDPFGDKPKKLTGGGQSGKKEPSTAAEVLETFAGKGHILSRLILQHRQYAKLKGTYMDGLPTWVDRLERIHTSLKSIGARTWRLASANPNLQNIPARDPVWGPRIRKLFIPGLWGDCDPAWCLEHLQDAPVPDLDPDFPMTLIVADYKQLEMRIMAHFCLHTNMRVSVADGSKMPIGKLVNGEWTGEVTSYDFNSGKKVARTVSNHFKNGRQVQDAPFRGGLKAADWTVIRHEAAPWMKLIITPEHVAYRPDGSSTTVRQLREGDELLYEESLIDGSRLQCLLGTLLGDGNFKKSKSKTSSGVFHGVSYYQAEDQRGYFDFKTTVFGDLVTSTRVEDRSKKGHQDLHRGKVRSTIQVERIAEMMLRADKKHPTIEVLGLLDARGLAIWYCDDGSLDQDERCSSEKGWSASITNVRITDEQVSYLRQKFGINFGRHKEGFGVSGANLERFFALIEKHIPLSMKYKVPPHLRTGQEVGWNDPIVEVIASRIIEKRKGKEGEAQMGCGSGSKYDITVEDTHRYFAQGILVSNSQDEGMIEAIKNNLDLHCQTVVLASERGVPGIPKGLEYDEVKAAKAADNPTPDQVLLALKRGELKSTGFGIIYGIGALKLGMQLGLPIVKRKMRNGQSRDWCPAAQELIDSYLREIYPGVGEWIEDTREMCREDLAVYTVIGHPRRLPDIVSRDRGKKAQAERQAGNSRIQGSAADITNEAMLRCEGDHVLRALGVRMLLQVHDELIFEVPDHPDFIEPAKVRIKELMEDPFDMLVPIEIDMDVAGTWGDAKG